MLDGISSVNGERAAMEFGTVYVVIACFIFIVQILMYGWWVILVLCAWS